MCKKPCDIIKGLISLKNKISNRIEPKAKSTTKKSDDDEIDEIDASLPVKNEINWSNNRKSTR